MSTNSQKAKRITKPIRVPIELHSLLKIRAAQDKQTISKLLEGIIKAHIVNN
jgi:predicted HicB family RNase H-like nuclease